MKLYCVSVLLATEKSRNKEEEEEGREERGEEVGSV